MRNIIRIAKVKEIRELLVKKATTVSAKDSVDVVISKLLENPVTRHVYVIDEENKMIGSIRMNNIIEYIFPFETIWLHDNYNKYLDIFYKETAEDLMVKDFVYVKNESTIADMVKLMDQTRINEMPVLNDEMNIIGEVNFLEVLRFIQNRNRSKEES